MEKNSSPRSSWRKLEMYQQRNWQKLNLSEEMAEKQLSKETAELSLQGSGKSRPQVMETTWEIRMIFP
jgi:hypothetical protein